jgi:hypothetical protein
MYLRYCLYVDQVSVCSDFKYFCQKSGQVLFTPELMAGSSNIFIRDLLFKVTEVKLQNNTISWHLSLLFHLECLALCEYVSTLCNNVYIHNIISASLEFIYGHQGITLKTDFCIDLPNKHFLN